MKAGFRIREMSTVLHKPNKSEHVGTRNLKPFQPGQSGNPLGRSIRKYSVVNQMKDLLAGVHYDKYTAEKLALEFMKRLYSKKTTPTVWVQMVSLLFQYTEQKPVQKIEVSTDDDDFRRKMAIFLEECKRLGLKTSEDEAARFLNEAVIETTAEVGGDAEV